MKSVAIIIGTRPEAIKLIPVFLEIKKYNFIRISLIFTGQHKEMVEDLFLIFDIKPDFNLKIMKENQTLEYVLTKSILEIGKLLDDIKPDCIIVQGDTTTAMAGSLSAFYRKIKIAHVEAGLRTGNIYSPFPEEVNRKIITNIAHFNFCPTERAKNNLLKEHVDEKSIYVTGNTVIDSLFLTMKKSNNLKLSYDHRNKLVLITAHRRENFGQPLKNLCEAILHLRDNYNDLEFLYPVHFNPYVRSIVYPLLENQERIHLTDPLNYVEFCHVMARSYIILSDSGGIQEEAPSLGKPILIFRDTTERPEVVEAGAGILVGIEKKTIIEN